MKIYDISNALSFNTCIKMIKNTTVPQNCFYIISTIFVEFSFRNYDIDIIFNIPNQIRYKK